MKRTVLKTFAAVLAVVMVMTVAGCGRATPAPTPETRPTGAGGPVLPYTGDTITYNFFSADYIRESNAPDAGFLREDKWERTGYGVFKSKLGNVEINWELVSGDDYATKFSLFMNSDDMPDVTSAGGGMARDYMDSGLFLDFNKYEHAMPNTWAYEKINPSVKMYTNSSGEFYLHPLIYPDITAEYFIANKTLLDEHGVSVPSNLDEFETAMQKLKDADSDITPFQSYGWGLGYYKGIWKSLIDAQPGMWSFTQNKYLHVLQDPEGTGYKELITRLADYYKRGFFNREFMTMTQDQVYESMRNSKWGFTFMYGIQSLVVEAYGINTNDEPLPIEVEAFLPPNKDGVKGSVFAAYVSDSPGYGYAVSVKAKNPEVACGLLDLTYDPEIVDIWNWGIEGVSYTVDSNGNKQPIPEFFDRDVTPSEVYADTGYRGMIIFGYGGIWDYTPSYRMRRQQDKEAIRMYVDAVKNGSYTVYYEPYEPFLTFDDRDEIGVINTQLNTFIDEMEMKFILGERPIAEFDNFVSEAKNIANVDRLAEIYNNAEQNTLPRTPGTGRNYIRP